jgi:D-serine deaminase-like pyridoxal phosphate-dependent protein
VLVSDLPTPALLVDLPRLAANLDRMQARADAAGVALRPHAKTHKTAEVARMQEARGARGLTVATVDEAEAFAAAGFTDVRLATPVAGPQKLSRIGRLLDAGVRLSFTVDTEAGARLASEEFAGRKDAVPVLIEVDTGHGRCGVPPAYVAAFAAAVAALPGLRLVGLLTHGGHSYAGPGADEAPRDALVRAMRSERDGVLDAAARLGAAGLLDPATAELSVGSTPTMAVFEPAERDGFRITEWRPGVYAFGDAQQVALGAVELRDCALVAVATVLSKRRLDDGTEQAVVDAGKKVLTADTGAGVDGYGTVLYSPRTMVANMHARMPRLSEEHGTVETPGGLIYDVGDPVFVVPNHACVAVATRPALFAVEGDEVVGTWAVLAR